MHSYTFQSIMRQQLQRKSKDPSEWTYTNNIPLPTDWVKTDPKQTKIILLRMTN